LGTADSLITHALVFANGDINDGPLVQKALVTARQSDQAIVVAADGGARVAQYYGLTINAVMGDFDSLSAAEIETLRAQNIDLYPHPPEKDETDLELALCWVAEQGVRWIRIIGGVGDRLDQTIANIYLLGLPSLTDRDVRVVANKQETWLIHPGTHAIQGTVDDTVSLIPLGGAVHGIRTENLFYPLCDETLLFGPARGISNVMTAPTAQVTFHTGTLLVIHTVGRA
jgi:thiamine pyrophosphokinase